MPRDQRFGVNLHLRQLRGQQLGGAVLPDAQHNQVVKVTLYLGRLGRIPDACLNIRRRLGIGRHLHAGTAPFVDERNKLIPHQLVKLIAVQVNQGLPFFPARQASIDTVFINVPGHTHQIGEHGVTDRARHFTVTERIEPHIHHGFFTDDLFPVKNRPRVVNVLIIRRQQLGGLTGGQFFQQRQQRRHDFVKVSTVITYR